jgi:hypothetical protein
MKRKSINWNFEQILDRLRAQGFQTVPWADASEAVLVSKDGVAAVLAAGASKDGPPEFVVAPGLLIAGQIGRLLDRGYQKFIHVSQFELPATAAELHAIHRFQEELKQTAGMADLFNEGLGTTSDLYQYDRLKNRESAQPAPDRPSVHPVGH